MSAGTDLIVQSILARFQRPKMPWSPPAFAWELDDTQKQPVYVDFNTPDQFRGDFDPAQSITKGCTKVYYDPRDSITTLQTAHPEFTYVAMTASPTQDGTAGVTSSADNSLTDNTVDFVAAGITTSCHCFITNRDVSSTTATTTTSPAKLIDTTKNFTALGLIAGTDKIMITGQTKLYSIASISTTTNPNDTLTLTPASGYTVPNLTGNASYSVYFGARAITSVAQHKITFATPVGDDTGVNYGCYLRSGITYETGSNGSDCAYVFWPSTVRYPVSTKSGWARRNLRISHTSGGGVNVPTRDVCLLWPTNGSHDCEFSLNGGIVVRQIGGHQKASNPPEIYPGYSGPTSGCDITNGDHALLKMSEVKHSVFTEGFLIDCNTKFGLDAFEPGSSNTLTEARPTFITQNTKIKGVHSDAATGLHADAYQPNGDTGWNCFSHVLIEGSYQGVFADQQGLLYGYIYDNCEMRYTDPASRQGYMFYLISTAHMAVSVGNSEIKPSTINKVYVGESTTPTYDDWEKFVVFPTDDVGRFTPDIKGVLSEDTNYMSWNDTVPAITGRIRKGKPPAGDIVREADIGYGYVSPGYQAVCPYPLTIPTETPYATKSGLVLTCVDPVYPGGANSLVTYQWYASEGTANGGNALTPKAITGATSQTYTVGSDAASIASATGLTIGTGSKAFTTASPPPFVVNQYVTAYSQADNSKYMRGVVTAVTSSSITITSSAVGGSGTVSDWMIAPGFIFCVPTCTNPAGTYNMPTNALAI